MTLYNILKEDAGVLAHNHFGAFKENSSILITGASGVIGINILAFLCNYKMRSLRLKIYVSVHRSESVNFINSIFAYEKLNFISLVTSSSKIFDLKNVKFDYIFHLATYGQPGKFVANGIETMKLNSTVLMRLFDLLNPEGKLFFSSSSEIYSGNGSVPHTEKDIGKTLTTHPRACYVESKRFGEALCYLKSQEGVSAYSGRISLSYGPGFRLDDQRVLYEFIFKALKHSIITLKDEGSSIRVYCYVRDTIDMILRLISSKHFEPLNLGGIHKISILNLSETIGKQLKVNIKVGNKVNAIKGAPDVVFSSQRLAEKLLNKKNYVSLEEGIKKTSYWAKELLKLQS